MLSGTNTLLLLEALTPPDFYYRDALLYISLYNGAKIICMRYNAFPLGALQYFMQSSLPKAVRKANLGQELRIIARINIMIRLVHKS